MSILHRIALRGDYQAQLLDMFPRLTAPQMIRFNDLVASDRLVTDDGEPTQALIKWVAGVAR